MMTNRTFEYHNHSLEVGIDYSCIPNFDIAVEEMGVSSMNFFCTFVHQNFVLPSENQLQHGFATDAFGYKNNAATMFHYGWHRRTIAKIPTELGKPGQEHLTAQRVTYLSRMLDYFKLLPLKAVMIAPRYANTYDISEVLRTKNNEPNPVPVWIKVTIDNVSEIRIRKHEKILEEERNNLEMETIMKGQEETAGAIEKSSASTSKETKKLKVESQYSDAFDLKYKYNDFFVKFSVDDQIPSESEDDEKQNEGLQANKNKAKEEEKDKNAKTEAQKEHDDEVWEWWSKLHEATMYNLNIEVVLELCDRTPDDYLIERWKSEPVAAIIVPTHVFYEKRGKPVLSYNWQNFIIMMSYYTRCKVIIGGHNTGFQRHPIVTYVLYIRKIWNIWQYRRARPECEKSLYGFINTTLHPNEHLFNRGKFRYGMIEKYRVAFQQVLEDKTKEKTHAMVLSQQYHNMEFKSDDGIIHIAVISALSQDMVDAIMHAAATLSLKIKIQLFVKCSTAITKKEIGKEDEWPDDVVYMYSADGSIPHLENKCDVAVFDVLGSWTGNKLTSAIIEDADNILREDCTLVPVEYISNIAPISSPILWGRAKAGFSFMFYDVKENNLETVWECYMRTIATLGEPKSAFTQGQPLRYPDPPTVDTPDEALAVALVANPTEGLGNRLMTWKIKMNGVVHGFAGNLTIKVSIPRIASNYERTNDRTIYTCHCLPLFIPLRIPVRMRKNQELHALFRRRATNDVWYDWQVMVEGVFSKVHNYNGESRHLRYLFEPFY